MSVQRFDPDWRAYHLKPNPDGAWVMYTDHARIVAEIRTAVQEWIESEEWSTAPLWAALDAIAGGTT